MYYDGWTTIGKHKLADHWRGKWGMEMAFQGFNEDLGDSEWITLILTAKEMGFTLDEVRSFLAKAAQSITRKE